MSHTRLAVASLIEPPVSMTKVLLLQRLWRMGGAYIGLCAGAYYASSFVEFGIWYQVRSEL